MHTHSALTNVGEDTCELLGFIRSKEKTIKVSAARLCPDASTRVKDPSVWFHQPLLPNLDVALGDPTSAIANDDSTFPLPVPLPVSPLMIILDTAGMSSAEFTDRVTVMVLT